MDMYCDALELAQNIGAKDMEDTRDVKGEDPEEEDSIPEEFTVAEPGLIVYPNPVQYQLNFRLVSPEKGQVRITLYDLLGKALISTTDYINGVNTLQGLVNIGSLPSGIYILKLELPGGKSLEKKILKK